jgi:hypothetical protein
LIGLLAVVGCGGELPGGENPDVGAELPADPIVNLWHTEGSCSVSFAFKANHTFSQSQACPVGDGVGVQVQDGLYTDAGDELVMTTFLSTCPGWQKVTRATYAVGAGDLILTGDAWSIVLLAEPPPATGGKTTLGCFFAPDGTAQPFQPSPLAPL